jgi:chemotaxis protein methyltransferase CheR
MIQRLKFSNRDFRYISALVSEHAGISLNHSKKELVYGRLSKRIRLLGLESFQQYCEVLKNGDQDEFVNCVNAITTNVTSFFRENHHFEMLQESVIPGVLASKREQQSREINIWSAGCSTGEEAYSIAMTIRECVPDISEWKIKILATDLDSNVLDQASRGVYQQDSLEGVSETRRKRWFLKGKESNAGLARLVPDIRNMVRFEQLNLVGTWNMHVRFDLVFCRNVMIYFDKQTRQGMVEGFADRLLPQGYLFVGHSESLSGLSELFSPIGTTIYRKCQ